MRHTNAPVEAKAIFSMDVSSQTPYKQLFAALRPGDTTTLFKIKGHVTLDPITQPHVGFLAGVSASPQPVL